MSLFSQDDLDQAPRGHLPFPGSDVEVVAYRTGDALCLIVNKQGICAYRATIANAFKPGIPNPGPSKNPLEDTFIIRYLNLSETPGDTTDGQTTRS